MSGQGNDVPCCFSFQFYIKPQRPCKRVHLRGVVSHSNSTSNHNCWPGTGTPCWLFLIPILHQTTTSVRLEWQRLMLFLIPILHQTTTSFLFSFLIIRLFLIPILHQTTTLRRRTYRITALFLIPILHQTTTFKRLCNADLLLFLIPILHQTTTSRMAVIHILHVTHMTPMHKTSCRTPGKLVGCNFVFQRAIYQKNSSCWGISGRARSLFPQ